MDLPVSLVIQRGCILHSTMFEGIDHGKFFVIIGEKDDYYAGFFFINSNINPINQKPEQMKMQYLLRPADYDFLTHDSFLCCTEVTPIAKSKLANSINRGETTTKGMLIQEHIDEVLSMVRNSKLFSKSEKETFFK